MTTTEQIKGIVALVRWGGIFDVDAKLIEISNEEEKTLPLILEQSKGSGGHCQES
jgi:hypothetical protein